MIAALLTGAQTVRRSWGLAVLVLLLNIATAALLAIPLVQLLERDLANKAAAARMMDGFDYPWWTQFDRAHPGWSSAFAPDIFGVGFALKNLDLLLHGRFPAGLFASRAKGDATDGVDGVVLGLGAVYLLIQTFLLGGILGVFRAEQGRWTLRGLLHGAGFYFGRLFRVALVALAADWLIFRLNAPIGAWLDRRALEAVSETGANAWTYSHYGVLLFALLTVHMVSSLAKVIVVLEERSSAILAVVSAAGFAIGNFRHALGQYLVVGVAGVGLLVFWKDIDSAWHATGYATQLVTLLLAQSLMLGRIGLRLALLASQMALYRQEL
jgi:hypothetical protein